MLLLILMINILIIAVFLDTDRHYEHHHCQDCHSRMIIWFPLMPKLFILMIRSTTQEFTSNTKHVALEDNIFSLSIGSCSGWFAIGWDQMCIPKISYHQHLRAIVAEALLWPKGADPY